MSLFEDPPDHADVAPTYEAEPWPGYAGLSERHLRLLRALWRCTAPGGAVACAKHATLAEMIGLKGEPKPGRQAQGSRQVRRLLSELYRRGLVVPLDDEHSKVPGPRGGRRLAAKYYALKYSLESLPPPAEKPQVAPLGHGNGAGQTARTSAAPRGNGRARASVDESAGQTVGTSQRRRSEAIPPGRTARTFEVPESMQMPSSDGISPGRTARTWPYVDNPQVAPLGHEPRCPSKNVSTDPSLEGEGEWGWGTGDPCSNPWGAEHAKRRDLAYKADSGREVTVPGTLPLPVAPTVAATVPGTVPVSDLAATTGPAGTDNGSPVVGQHRKSDAISAGRDARTFVTRTAEQTPSSDGKSAGHADNGFPGAGPAVPTGGASGHATSGHAIGAPDTAGDGDQAPGLDADLAAVLAVLRDAGLEPGSVEVYPNGHPALRPRQPAPPRPARRPPAAKRNGPLTGSLEAFHDAVDRLERSTCTSELDRCRPGHRCRRHTPRSERYAP